MHFYESSIITTKDGLHCQVYGNEHPGEHIIVKPKYIPTDKIASSALSFRFISGKRMNRLNMWIDKQELRQYIEGFKKNYPHYVFKSPIHGQDRLFFTVHVDDIEKIYFPRRGLKELMSMPEECLDDHLRAVYDFVEFIMKSGLAIKDLGLTYSTLMGHYMSKISDINIVVYGKQNYWRLMSYLETASHPLLKWKTKEQWTEFYNKRNRFSIFDKEQFVKDMSKKRSEGFFNNTLFVIFAAEKEDEVWFKWGQETYHDLGIAEIEAVVCDNTSSVVRPGCYDVEDSIITNFERCEKLAIDGLELKKIVFYSRDYCMIANKGDRIRAKGLLEKVESKNGTPYLRLVIGYFDAYISDRREQEFIKVINN
ncbi:MAG: hypothetical protein HZB65_02970 [Candidatus Aenigmarchaeota archaeon]|nr:hypothetical protein [Candidatus Aenigmarchaeota archaeon]